jgi:hypothetical protein
MSEYKEQTDCFKEQQQIIDWQDELIKLRNEEIKKLNKMNKSQERMLVEIAKVKRQGKKEFAEEVIKIGKAVYHNDSKAGAYDAIVFRLQKETWEKEASER